MSRILIFALGMIPPLFSAGCASVDKVGEPSGRVVTTMTSKDQHLGRRSVTELARDFHSLKNGSERIHFFVQLVEDGVIGKGTKIEDVVTVFGDRYVGSWQEGSEQGGTVYLADARGNLSDSHSTQLPTGWWAALYYDADGKVTCIFMTNVWKDSNMDERWKAYRDKPGERHRTFPSPGSEVAE